ncbi:hypothetical protein [Vibrio sp. SCSIO 43136]|uniref:hypothetical protein n=1 Tax=Vibrio sp. SCSIO 43136 TaxID=2819101 RepID=UPI0020754D13|nr:hypothetical protein [Vibrio sp. SCSIO 43136]USD68120.1 hypothetical protein J4N39_18270 [Vibrio sp. SCSIO 43136]
MSDLFKSLMERYSEWKGRVIAYGGGSGLVAFSHDAAAEASKAVDTSPDISMANYLTMIGLFFIGARLVFDICVFIYKVRTGTLKDKEQQ